MTIILMTFMTTSDEFFGHFFGYFFGDFLIFFLTNFLTLANFRIGVPSIFFLFVDIVFGKKITRNLKSPTFAILNNLPLWILIQGWKDGQERPYIHPSNLSSASIRNFIKV